MSSKLYMDACCIIEAVKGRLGRTTQHSAEEVDMIQRLLRAARDGEIEVFTSMTSIAEVLYVDKDEKPPIQSTKDHIERLLLSGKDGVKLVATSPATAIKARDLAWQMGIYTRSIDLIHVASAFQCGAEELVTLDGRLAKKLKRAAIGGMRIIDATKTQLLPDEYRTDDLFNKK